MHSLRSTSRTAKLAKRRRWRCFEALEPRALLTSVPYGALSTDNGEYMLGDVNVTVVFLESNGQLNPSTENWTPAAINASKEKITTGLNWWVDTLHQYHPDAYLNFHVDFAFADTPFETKYEPINNTSNVHTQYVQEFLVQQGSWINGDITTSIFAFNNAQRIARGTNWSFTMFIVNDANDLDKQFAVGGNFSRSFAYGNGRYVVALASRPPEIIAHETGHIFGAADEYSGGDSYQYTAGYYNQQNTNGATGAPVGFVQQNSLMSSGILLTTSYNTHTLPASTRAMIGWRDSDGDGIIDVLDVPLTLTGEGFRTTQGTYRFVGESRVQTLLNQATGNNKNDITINRIRLAEYRLDDGEWQTAATYDTYSATLDLNIEVPAGEHTIEIRTRDTVTGATSAIFTASTAQRATITNPGISGFVFNDANNNSLWDANESALAGRTLQLVDSLGTPLAGPTVINPDAYAVGTILTKSNTAFILMATGGAAASADVTATDGIYGSTASRMFGNSRISGPTSVTSTLWSPTLQLRINLPTRTNAIAIDAIGTAAGSYGRLEIYDANDQLLGRYTTQELGIGVVEKMVLARSTADIAYVIAYGHANSRVALDNLRIGPESTATTNEFGAYSFAYLTPGTYLVKSTAPTNWNSTTPSNAIRTAHVVADETTSNVLFGQRTSVPLWQNQQNRFDVNGDSIVAPLDALLIINSLNALGARELIDPPAAGETAPNLIDVNGDGIISPADALEVIIWLNSRGTGEAIPPASFSPPPMSPEAAISPEAATLSPQGEADPIAYVADGTMLTVPAAPVISDEAQDVALRELFAEATPAPRHFLFLSSNAPTAEYCSTTSDALRSNDEVIPLIDWSDLSDVASPIRRSTFRLPTRSR